MKTLAPLLVMISLALPAAGQNDGDFGAANSLGSSIDSLKKKYAGTQAAAAATTTKTNTSTLGAAEEEAADDLRIDDQTGDVTATYGKGKAKKSYTFGSDQKREIFDELAKLMEKTNRTGGTYAKSIVLKGKTLGLFGREIKATLCSSPKVAACAGNVLQVSWAKTETTKTTMPGETCAAIRPDAAKHDDMVQPNTYTLDLGSERVKELDREISAYAGGTLVKIDIFSSASTLRNTGAAESLSHEQLARARAHAILDHAVAQFAKLTPPIVVDASLAPLGDAAEGNDVVELLFSGNNFNGTSGPNPPSNYAVTPDVRGGRAEPMSSSDAAMLKTKIPHWPSVDLDASGNPVADQAEAVKDYYNRYQYDEVVIDVLMPETTPAAQTEETSTSKLYYAGVGIYQPGQPARNTTNSSSRVPSHVVRRSKIRAPKHTADCPIF